MCHFRRVAEFLDRDRDRERTRCSDFVPKYRFPSETIFFLIFFSYYSLHWYDICLNMLLISSMVLFFVSGTFLYMKIVKNSCSIAKMMNT